MHIAGISVLVVVEDGFCITCARGVYEYKEYNTRGGRVCVIKEYINRIHYLWRKGLCI
jgi:hypothetical protein